MMCKPNVDLQSLEEPFHLHGVQLGIQSTWRRKMGTAGIGWIAAIIIGGVAGWLAEMFMKSDMGIIMNVLLGIVGAIVANALLSLFGIVLSGWLGYLIAGFIGACLLIAIARMFRRSPAV
jgi:uncharacterized membrane protein YeaQ/YmgE (transglycosylase-associated protein family)